MQFYSLEEVPSQHVAVIDDYADLVSEAGIGRYNAMKNVPDKPGYVGTKKCPYKEMRSIAGEVGAAVYVDYDPNNLVLVEDYPLVDALKPDIAGRIEVRSTDRPSNQQLRVWGKDKLAEAVVLMVYPSSTRKVLFEGCKYCGGTHYALSNKVYMLGWQDALADWCHARLSVTSRNKEFAKQQYVIWDRYRRSMNTFDKGVWR